MQKGHHPSKETKTEAFSPLNLVTALQLAERRVEKTDLHLGRAFSPSSLSPQNLTSQLLHCLPEGAATNPIVNGRKEDYGRGKL